MNDIEDWAGRRGDAVAVIGKHDHIHSWCNGDLSGARATDEQVTGVPGIGGLLGADLVQDDADHFFGLGIYEGQFAGNIAGAAP